MGMNESRHLHEWVMSLIWMRMNESCHLYEWVWMSHVTYMNESCHLYECVWTSPVIYMNGYEWVTSLTWMSHVTYMSAHDCVMSVIWVRMNEYGWVWISTNAYECTWMRKNESGWVMSSVWLRHVNYVNAYGWVMSLIYMGMGWLRLVDFLKLVTSFAKEPYKKDFVLQKRSIILRSLLIVATPYGWVLCHLYECVWMSYVTDIHGYGSVLSRSWISHVTQI